MEGGKEERNGGREGERKGGREGTKEGKREGGWEGGRGAFNCSFYHTALAEIQGEEKQNVLEAIVHCRPI